MMGIALMVTGSVIFFAGLMLYVKHHKKEVALQSKKELVQVIRTAAADGTLSKRERQLIIDTAIAVGENPDAAIAMAESLMANNNEPSETEIIDQNQRNGIDFEKYVVQNFDQKYFKVIKWAGDKYVNGIYSEENMHPDLLLEFKLGNQIERFAVECKWRSTHLQGKVMFSSKKQVERYQNFGIQENLPVFIALGYGGTAAYPAELYVIPIEVAAEGILTFKELQPYRKDPNKRFFYDLRKKILS
jgi:hypothetical protein